MKPGDEVGKEAQEKPQATGLGPRYLDWWLGHEKPPSYKNISDNLRAYLTIGAYLVLLHYLWHWGPDRIPGWVFQATAIIWGGWVFWFALLTVVQTWHLYLGFCFELAGIFLEPYAKHKKGQFTETEVEIIKLLLFPLAISGLGMVGTVFYVIGAMLKSAKVY
jgi:hypothetical protein